MTRVPFHTPSIVAEHSWPRGAKLASRSGFSTYRVLLGLLVCALVIASLADWSSIVALLNRLNAIHIAFGASLLSLLVLFVLSIVSGVASALLAMVELAPRLALGGAMMGVLPFAQASDPPAGKSASGNGAAALQSEIQVGVYGGKSFSPPSDVRLVAPDGTDMLITDILWKTESFKPSPYYGGRGIDWNTTWPALGIMVDFTHAKATAIRSQTIKQSGKHKGEELPPEGPFEAIFRKLEFTHGLNFITLNGVYRIGGLHRRIVPYAGVGVGFMIPHVEAWRAGVAKKDIVHEAQLTGAVYQLLAGIEWRVLKPGKRSLFTEYKLSQTMNEVKLKDGGTVWADILAHQFNAGIYFTPWRAGAAAK